MKLQSFMRDALRALRNGKLEDAVNGRLYVPGGAGFFLGGVFRAQVIQPDGAGAAVIGYNRLVKQGRDRILNLLGQHATASALYLAPFVNNVEVSDDWKGSDWAGLAGEFTAYTAGTRVPWTTETSTAQTLSNEAALASATITLAAGGPYTIRGCALVEASAKNATTGALIAASPYESALAGLAAGSKVSLQYVLQALDEADA